MCTRRTEEGELDFPAVSFCPGFKRDLIEESRCYSRMAALYILGMFTVII